MCGIAGLYLKNAALSAQLGALFTPMLERLSERGPDSAGVAAYRGAGDSAPRVTSDQREAPDIGRTKLTLFCDQPGFDWHQLFAALRTDTGSSFETAQVADHCVLRVTSNADDLLRVLRERAPAVRLMSRGQSLEIFKGVGLPATVLNTYGVQTMIGTHMLGHTRMATESAVSTQGAHPFSSGDDLCLVHNGSLSNHNRVRKSLQRASVEFVSENDSEVAASYIAWRLDQGLSIAEALTSAIEDLDGFYTFAVGTRTGFAVLRDPIACKPAVLAETENWVAMASEFRALANLPGIREASVWEPEPGVVYSWGEDISDHASTANPQRAQA